MNNTNELTQDLPQKPESAPSTEPLLKELLADVRSLKSTVEIILPQVLERLDRIEQKVDSLERKVDSVERKVDSLEIQVKLLHEDQFGIRTDAVKLVRRVDELERRAS